GFRSARRHADIERIIAYRNLHVPAVDQLAEQQLLGKRSLDVLLDDSRHRTRAHLRIITTRRQPRARLVIHLYSDTFLLKLCLELEHELADHLSDSALVEPLELDDGIKAVAELG